MLHTRRFPRRVWRNRAMSLVLTLAILLGLVPALPVGQAQAHWADSSLNQLVEWGFIRADQAEHPDQEMTRADFMSIVNRAYGYHELGDTPFTDVEEKDWFYDDVGIAYTAKYIKGTSPTTASPNDTLTRETAATILGRNMMLQESAGEILDFTDAREISSWARGTIKSSLEHYLVSGYDDGTFKPKKDLAWGEMASMLSRIVGTPLQEPGDYALGGVFGNVTITSPGVTLRDSIISGDLYVTGGVGLGDVKLENVTVLGRIIASGTGESESGGASIVLRNVVADELLVDNLQNNYVTLKADGITEIGHTTVRTSAYIEDNTPDGMGLKYISLEGDPPPAEGEEGAEDYVPIQLDLAGRIEEVVNRTPGSQVRAAKGTVAKLTVDEAATNSTVIIDRNTVVKELNLDVGTAVSGEGDVEKLNVNAPGSTVTMLPDEIYIRPGLTAVINGQVMDSTAAEESSREPMILAGYPSVTDVAPNSATAVFSTNKRGTIYWAVSAITDGSVGEDDLIKPPAYGSIAVQRGSLISPQGDTEVTAAITGLTADGSYYLSAVMVDDRGQRSPTKVISFTTPDNTVPAFNTGYPHMSSTSPKDSVAVVSATKDCVLYYALMPQNAQAPTVNELKAAAVSGALGYGVRTLEKNIEDAFRINDRILEEKTSYTVYFWLTDANGANSSAVVPLTFTTDDETPPKFIVEPTPTPTSPTSVSLTFRLDEDGTVYWVAVPSGYLYPWPDKSTEFETAPLDSLYAIMQVTTGMNKGTNGLSGTVRAVANQDGTINVTGMLPEQAYDFYYVAKDDAGPDRNYSVGGVKKITIHPTDNTGPLVRQSFTKPSAGTIFDPTSNTDIILTFSEDVKYNGQGGNRSFLEMWQDIEDAASEADRRSARDKLTACLRATIELNKRNPVGNLWTPQEGYTAYHPTTTEFPSQYELDYSQAVISAGRDGAMVLTFPNSGLHLENGARYCFVLRDLIDTSDNRNPLRGETGIVDFITNNTNPDGSNAADHFVPPFTVEPATLIFDTTQGIGNGDGPYKRESGVAPKDLSKPDYIDWSFQVQPNSTSTVSETLSFDLLFFTNKLGAFDLYYRVIDADGNKADASNNLYTADSKYALPRYANSKGDAVGSDPDKNGWVYLGNSGDIRPNPTTDFSDWRGRSLGKYFNGCDSTNFPKLAKMDEDMRYEFVITMTKVDILGGENDRPLWNQWVYFEVNAAAGQSNQLDGDLAGTTGTPNRTAWDRYKENDASKDIGRWVSPKTQQEQNTLELEKEFKDNKLPEFDYENPIITKITDTTADLYLALQTPGLVYYAISPAVTSTSNITRINATRKFSAADGDRRDYQIDPDTGTNIPNVRFVGGSGDPDLVYVDMDYNSPPPADGSVPMPNWMRGGTGTTDDPSQPNMIQFPTNEDICYNNINGIVRKWRGFIETTDTLEPDPVTITDLTPDSTYYLYCVIKGNSTEDLSHVYMYQFTTEKSANPIITLGPIDEGASISTDIASKLWYLAFTYTDLQKIDILKREFKGAPKFYTDRVTGTYTVLNALLDTYLVAQAEGVSGDTVQLPENNNGEKDVYDGYSVFDLFADVQLKGEMSSFLRGRYMEQYLGDITPSKRPESALMLGAGEVRRENLGMAPATQYVILAVAQSQTANGTEAEVDSYAAYMPLFLGGIGAPKITDWDAWGMEGYQDDNFFPGSIEITYNQPLYTDKNRTELTVEFLNNNILKSLYPRIQASITKTDTETTITFTPQNAQVGWLANKRTSERIRIPGSTFWSFDGIPDTNPLTLLVRKDTNLPGIVVDYTWGEGDSADTDSREFPYLTPEVSELKLSLSCNNAATASWIKSWQATGNRYTLEMDGSKANSSDPFKQAKISISTFPPDSNLQQLTYEWVSSDTSVVAIAGSGAGASEILNAVGIGQADVTVTAHAKVNGEWAEGTATIRVTVTGTVTVVEAAENAAGRLTPVMAAGGTTISGFEWNRSNNGSNAIFKIEANPGLGSRTPVTWRGDGNVIAANPMANTDTHDNKTAQASMQIANNTQTSNGTILITVGSQETQIFDTKTLEITIKGSDSRINGNNPIAQMPTDFSSKTKTAKK